MQNVGNGLPQNWEYLTSKHGVDFLCRVCRSAGIWHERAFEKFTRSPWGWRPVVSGVVIYRHDQAAFDQAYLKVEALRLVAKN